MIKYENIIETAKVVMSQKDMYVDGLTLEYVLPNKIHDKLNEELFYRTLDNGETLEYVDIIELTVLDVKFKFLKKDE
jgi:hypothetical protein